VIGQGGEGSDRVTLLSREEQGPATAKEAVLRRTGAAGRDGRERHGALVRAFRVLNAG